VPSERRAASILLEPRREEDDMDRRGATWGRRFVILSIAAVTATALAACGGGGGGKTTLDVTLQEFSVIPAQDSVSAGDVTFRASNKGPNDVHELVVIKTDLDPDQLPTEADGSVNEEASGLEGIGEVEDVEVGQTKTFTVNLDPGHYVMICNIVDKVGAHYKDGMRTALTVD